MTDLGLLRQFLGLELEKNERGIKMSQPKYASDLINNFNMSECKAYKSPLLSSIKMHEFGNSPLVDITLYRQLVGNLLYLTHTRPNLSYAVSAVARHMHQPHELHWRAVLPPFTHLGYVVEIFKPLGVSLGASLESRLSPCS